MNHFDFLVDLLGLLKWNSMVGRLKEILVTVMKVSGEEIVKVCAQKYIYICVSIVRSEKFHL